MSWIDLTSLTIRWCRIRTYAHSLLLLCRPSNASTALLSAIPSVVRLSFGFEDGFSIPSYCPAPSTIYCRSRPYTSGIAPRLHVSMPQTMMSRAVMALPSLSNARQATLSTLSLQFQSRSIPSSWPICNTPGRRTDSARCAHRHSVVAASDASGAAAVATASNLKESLSDPGLLKTGIYLGGSWRSTEEQLEVPNVSMNCLLITMRLLPCICLTPLFPSPSFCSVLATSVHLHQRSFPIAITLF